jgi:hypothetical protein
MCNKQQMQKWRLSTIETSMNRRFQMHNMQMVESKEETTQQWTTPGHMMNEPTMTRKMNGFHLLKRGRM